MHSASMFSHAISGSFSEAGIRQYREQVMSTGNAFTGWLGQQVSRIQQDFVDFFDSRAWELSKRLLGGSKQEYVSAFDIGYLGSLPGLQTAEGLMRNYIMAHEGLMGLYVDERIEGYGGEFNDHCTGIGEDNLFWRNAMNGVLTTSMVDDKEILRHKHYYETLNGELSFRQRVDIHKTWNAITHHLANKDMFDITSKENAKIKPLD